MGGALAAALEYHLCECMEVCKRENARSDDTVHILCMAGGPHASITARMLMSPRFSVILNTEPMHSEKARALNLPSDT